MDIWFGYMPLIVLASGVQVLDQGHNGVTIKPSSVIERVKSWRDDGVEFCKVIIMRRGEERAHDVYDFAGRRLLGLARNIP